MRSGDIDLKDVDTFGDGGRYGYGWTAASYTNAKTSYFFGIAPEIINPSNSANRSYGFPLRCLAS